MTERTNEKDTMSVSFKDRAYQHIRSKILHGGLAAGARLSEEALALEIGISRTPVREALSRLASEGLARQLPHYGVFVRKFEREELSELYDLRVMLESYAAGHAAMKRTEAQLMELEIICSSLRGVAEEFRESGASILEGKLGERQMGLDVQFHTLILEASQRPQSIKVASDLRLLTQICGRRRLMPTEGIEHILAKTYREHQAILKALQDQDVDGARQWMRVHLERGKVEGLAAFDRWEDEQREGKDGDSKDELAHYRKAGQSVDGKDRPVSGSWAGF